MQKTYCRVSAKEERLKQSPLFADFERKIASLSLSMTGKTSTFAQILYTCDFAPIKGAVILEFPSQENVCKRRFPRRVM